MLSLRQNNNPSFPGACPGKDTQKAANAATKEGVNGGENARTSFLRSEGVVVPVHIMKFTSDKFTLLNAVTPAMYASSTKTTLPILESLMFRLKDNELLVYGYDLERGIRTSSTVYGMSDGVVMINAQKICGIIKNFPDGEIQIESDEKNIVRIVGGMSDITVHGLSADTYPSLPELHGENRFTISAHMFRDIIATTSYAISQTDAKPILKGEFFKIENKKVTAVATDTYCLSMRTEMAGVESDNLNFHFVVPGKTLSDLSRLLSDSDEIVTVEFTRKYVIFKYKDIVVFSRLLEGEYIDYERAIPSEEKTFVRINRMDLIESVERASLIVDEKMKTPLICTFGGDIMNIKCSTQFGKVNDNIRAKITGEEITIGFNNRFLLDTLRACRDEEVTLGLTKPLMPMTVTSVKPSDASSYLYLVLPMRIK